MLNELFIIIKRHIFRLEEFQRHQVVVELISLNIVLDSERVVSYDVFFINNTESECMLDLFFRFVSIFIFNI